ncbi:MAG: hypothetical protein LBE82_09985 [Chitinophagaceae bacterium]|jgi:hypothetical protein|nr:hypothetical protein [Chitinophagaceae bacterium]
MNRNFVSLFIVFLFTCVSLFAQSGDIPAARKSFHDRIDRNQEFILGLDGIPDNAFTPSKTDTAINRKATLAATKQIDDLQNYIEKNKGFDNNRKIKYLRGLGDLLESFRTLYKIRAIKGSELAALVQAFREAIPYEEDQESLIPVILKYPPEVGQILIDNFSFKFNPYNSEARNAILYQSLKGKDTQTLLAIMNRNPGNSFMDSIIKAVAYSDPTTVYTYSKNTSDPVGAAINKSTDPLVKTIVTIGRQKSAMQFFPFLDNLYKGKISMDEIDSTLGDDMESRRKYLKLLIRTEIDYAGRLMKRDTPMNMDGLASKLKRYAYDCYVDEINGLHEQPDNIRFQCIRSLSPQELYFLAVMCEEEIYTSSYTRGVYPLIWKNGGKEFTGDSLLMNVNFSHFKKWIKMAANDNTLDDFLKRMNKRNATDLMRAFVRNLDKKTGANSLEDAVDVASSYASINDPEIKNLVLREVQYSLKASQNNFNKKAYNIYDILNVLFLSMEPDSKVDVSQSLGIAPVYYMPVDRLKDSAGKVNIVQYFYGDKDGKVFYPAFISSMASQGWKSTSNDQWSVTSKGNIFIYTNKPLNEEQDLDNKAQEAMNDYLDNNNITPSLLIHRGHSYWLKSTLSYMQPSEQVVILGSCGGYQSLSSVLKISPEAQIIASKQTGAGVLNLAVISSVLNNLAKGKDLDWISIWKDLSKKIGKNDMFLDYVPPYKNLGAVFLIAFQKMQAREAGEE